MRPTPPPQLACRGCPEPPGDTTIDEWLSHLYVFVRQCGVQAVVLVDYLGECAKEEVSCHPGEVCRDFWTLVYLLRRVWPVGDRDVAAS